MIAQLRDRVGKPPLPSRERVGVRELSQQDRTQSGKSPLTLPSLRDASLPLPQRGEGQLA